MLQGAEIYQVLAPERLSQIRVTPLEAIPAVNISGSLYHAWEGRDFGPGQGLTLELGQLPQPGIFTRVGKSVSDERLWRIAIPSMLGVVLALLLIYAGFKAPRSATATPATPAGPGANGTPTEERAALVMAVATLDQQFHQGDLAEDEYRTHRIELRARIEDR